MRFACDREAEELNAAVVAAAALALDLVVAGIASESAAVAVISDRAPKLRVRVTGAEHSACLAEGEVRAASDSAAAAGGRGNADQGNVDEDTSGAAAACLAILWPRELMKDLTLNLL